MRERKGLGFARWEMGKSALGNDGHEGGHNEANGSGVYWNHCGTVRSKQIPLALKLKWRVVWHWKLSLWDGVFCSTIKHKYAIVMRKDDISGCLQSAHCLSITLLKRRIERQTQIFLKSHCFDTHDGTENYISRRLTLIKSTFYMEKLPSVLFASSLNSSF